MKIVSYDQNLKFGWNGTLIALLLGIFLFANCISMAIVLHVQGQLISWRAVGSVSLLAAFIPLFILARFSFGYFAALAFYSMITGFIWLSYFTPSHYDFVQARWPAAASLLMFIVPLLFQTTRLRLPIALSTPVMDRVLIAALVATLVVIGWGASYGFAFAGIHETEELRSTFSRPTIFNYISGSLIGGTLPFSFAYFAWRQRYLLAAVPVLLLVCFYPVVLNKTALFGAVWLPFLFLVFKRIEPRKAAVLSLLVPILAGVIGYVISQFEGAIGTLAFHVFGYTSRRMFAYPSFALDRYSDFFANHEITRFCQIGIIRALRGCPYAFQLGSEMATRYGMGNLNGSLFATEGIASVGPIWAPLSALICGLILSIGNSVSTKLPAPLIASSAGLATEALLNVPLSASLLSNGVFVLFLLWWITPEDLSKRF